MTHDSVLATDKFYRGTISRLLRGAGSGTVRSESGREVTFLSEHVQLIGPVRRLEQLREGMHVGFDVGWTSGGLRVTVMRAEAAPAGSEAVAGPGVGSREE